MVSMQAALPASYYVADDHWRRERDVVLHAEWFCVGRLSTHGIDVGQTGRLAVIDVAGESVLVTRDREGRLRAFFNVCRHRGSQIVPVDPALEPPSPCRAASLRCPYHSWTYDLDGRLLRAPHTEDVDDFAAADFGLREVAAATWGGFLFLRLAPGEAPELLETLGLATERISRYPLDSLEVGATLTYDVRANYKVVLENYNECYHCAGVHPELVRLVPAFGRGGSDLDWDDGIPHRDGAWTFTASGTSARAPFAGLDIHEQVRHKGELLYPNLMLSLSADHVAAFTLWPTSAGETRIVCDLLFAPDEVAREAFDPSDAAEFWHLVNQQDWAICESVQRGMSSRGFTRGWFAPMEDASLDIRRWLLPRLGEAAPSVDQP
jgi:phenylpropionate dioxygenase-like ring-hydroxylating dioxygenase large terminal subunit